MMSPSQDQAIQAALSSVCDSLERRKARHEIDAYEIFAQSRTARKVESKDGQMEGASLATDSGLSVRIQKNHRLGFGFSTALNPSSLELMVKTAIEMTEVLPEDSFATLPDLSKFQYTDLTSKLWRLKPLEFNHQIDLAKSLEKKTRALDPRINGVRSAAISTGLSEFWLVNSSRSEALHSQIGTISASISCKAEQDGESQMGGDYRVARTLEELDLDAVAREAAQSATELLGGHRPASFKCPAILRNSVMSELIEFVSDSVSAESLDKKRSLLLGGPGQAPTSRLGETCFSNVISILQDPADAEGLGAESFDAEGIAAAPLPLFENGAWKSILTNHYYATKMGLKHTANAGRSIKSPPSISAGNLRLKAGLKSVDSLISDITLGVEITELMGLHTANSITGDFSVGASGILIENGKRTRPIRGFAISGKIMDLFQKVTDVANDSRYFGSVATPSCRISELTVSGE